MGHNWRTISSREHPLVKQIIKLEKSAQYRKKIQLTVLDGIHLIENYLRLGNFPKMVIIDQSQVNQDEIKQILDQIVRENDTQFYQFTPALFRYVAPVKSPTGILSIIPINLLQNKMKSRTVRFCVLLEAIQDPGNLGSILRSAAAANVDSVYLSNDCVDVWSPKTLRAAMGAHFSLKIYQDCDLLNVIRKFDGTVIATTLQAKKSLYQTQLIEPLAFVFGNEGSGLSKIIRETVHEQIMIPMHKHTESLNAAAAAAICFFEKVRQDLSK